MSDDLERDLRDYYRSLPEASAHRSEEAVSNALRGRERRTPRLTVGTRIVALAGVLALAAVVGLGPLLLSHPQPRPAPTPSVGPVETAATPTFTPVPTATRSRRWVEIVRDWTLGVEWSPDGNYLAVSEGLNNGLPPHEFELFASSGRRIGGYEGQWLCWLDSTSFLVERDDQTIRQHIDGETTFWGGPAGGLSNGHGVVAFPRVKSTEGDEKFILSDGLRQLGEFAGQPLVWSNDGRLLAVDNLVPGQPQRGVAPPLGRLSILDLETLRIRTLSDSSFDGGFSSFDPTARYLIAGQTIYDVSTARRIAKFPGSQRLAWYQGMVLGTSDGGSLVSLVPGASNGIQTLAAVSLGEDVASSADGSTAVVYTMALETDRISMLKDGTQNVVAVPLDFGWPVISPDGAHVAIVCDPAAGENQLWMLES